MAEPVFELPREVPGEVFALPVGVPVGVPARPARGVTVARAAIKKPSIVLAEPALAPKPWSARVATAVASRTAQRTSILHYGPVIGRRAAMEIATRQARGIARGMARMPRAAGRHVAKTLTERRLITTVAGGAVSTAKRGVDTQQLKNEILSATREYMHEQLERYAATRDPAILRAIERTQRGVSEIEGTPDMALIPWPIFPIAPVLAKLKLFAVLALLFLLWLLKREK